MMGTLWAQAGKVLTEPTASGRNAKHENGRLIMDCVTGPYRQEAEWPANE